MAREEPSGPDPAPPGLLEAIGGLPERYRVVVNLHFLEEMEQAEVSRSLGIAPGTVRSRLHRAMGILRSTLEKGGGRR
jgi:RNA polymerase sigma-70 factor (ECF subfamily)